MLLPMSWPSSDGQSAGLPTHTNRHSLLAKGNLFYQGERVMQCGPAVMGHIQLGCPCALGKASLLAKGSLSYRASY